MSTVCLVTPGQPSTNPRLVKEADALAEAGYDVIPVNPKPTLTEIRGTPVAHSLREIDRPVDMVEVFRPSAELYGIAEQAVAIGAKVLWSQLGIRDERAAELAEDAGLQVVMDRCPKIELSRPA